MFQEDKQYANRNAIIDIGTNTFKLLIVDLINTKEQTHKVVYDSKLPVKLGENGISKNIIPPKAFERGLQALEVFKSLCLFYKVPPLNIYAYATSGLRTSDNGAYFRKYAQFKTGIPIQIISGIKEAQYIYHGVKQAVNLGNSPVLIMDIGGGSVEFIIADNKTVYTQKSFKIGAARLLERFGATNPATTKQVEKIQQFIKKRLGNLFVELKKYHVNQMVGCSGSFDSFAWMMAFEYDKINQLKNKQSFYFPIHEFYAMHNTLLKTTYNDRLKIKGLLEMRAEMIVLAGILIEYIAKSLNIKEIGYSTYSLKEGLLYSKMQMLA